MTITLDLSPEIQSKLEALAIQNGLAIEIIANNLIQQGIEKADTEVLVFPPNVKALAALRKIAAMQAGMRQTDGSQTERIIREGRAGGMYRDDDIR